MQRDRERVVVDAPQLLEDALGLAAGVDEDQRGLVALDELVDLADGVVRRMAGPRQALVAVEHADLRRGAAVGHHEIGKRLSVLGLRHQEAAQIVGLRHRRREADAGEVGRQREQPRQAEREEIAALGGDQRMQLVEHDPPQRAEQIGRVGRGENERELLGRGQQNVRRVAALALALGGRRVAGAGLDPDRQRHLGDRRFEVARDVDGERLERRDVKRVQPALAANIAAGGDELARAPGRSAKAELACKRGRELAERVKALAFNSTRLGKNPASVLPAPVGAISSTERPARALASNSSWCSRGAQPRRANQPANGSGSGEAWSSANWTFMTGQQPSLYFVASAFSTKLPVWVFDRSTVAPATAGSNTRSTWWAVSTAPGTKRPSGEYMALLAAIART